MDIDETTPETELLKREQSKRLATAMERLLPRVRRVLRMRFLHHLTQEEIAIKLGVSQQDVSRIETEALATLRAGLQ